jgi:L-serine deaminase
MVKGTCYWLFVGLAEEEAAMGGVDDAGVAGVSGSGEGAEVLIPVT